jgi:signal transduction histidine kinase
VFRFASVAYAAALVVANRESYSRPLVAGLVLAAMAIWTAVSSLRYSSPAGRTFGWLTADLMITGGALLSTMAAQYPSAMRAGLTPVTATWVAGPVLAFAVRFGRRASIIVAVLLSGCDFLLRGERASVTVSSTVLLLLAGVTVGYLAAVAELLEYQRGLIIEDEATARERDRLARDIHDSVLQVLAMVQRRGAEAGGEAAELGRLAGQQETALRMLIGSPAIGDAAEQADLRTMLAAAEVDGAVISGPANVVMVDVKTGAELASAVRAALDNVARHCGGARAWVLIEDEPEAVTVTVRDDGPGMAAGRLAEAAADGRLGVSHSIIGRMRDIGGSARVTSRPGEGTEVELRVPRH